MSTFLSCKNDFLHAELESQQDKKRLWLSHFKRFKLQHKAKRNVESDPSYHLLKKALKKMPMIAQRDVWSLFTHIYSVATDRAERFAITSWKGKSHQKVWTSTKSEEKPQKVLIVEPFEEDDEKAQYASFKHIKHIKHTSNTSNTSNT